MLKDKNLSGIRLSLRDVKFLLLLHWYPFKWLWQPQELQLTAGCLGRARESVLVTAGTSCSTTRVLMLRLFELGVCALRRGQASSSGTLLQRNTCQAQLLCPCPEPLLVIMGPYGKPAQGAGWNRKDHFQVNLHHFQLPEITRHCCCMSASARSRQKMGRAGNESEGRTAFKTLKLL